MFQQKQELASFAVIDKNARNVSSQYTGIATSLSKHLQDLELVAKRLQQVEYNIVTICSLAKFQGRILPTKAW